jgi:hypothetical protein
MYNSFCEDLHNNNSPMKVGLIIDKDKIFELKYVFLSIPSVFC